MSKKDYQAVARVIHGSGLQHQPGYVSLVEELARVFAEDNPRFDRERFVEACETGRCKGMKGAEPLPLCARAMGCLCAAHAKGRKASGPCDASEDVRA